MGTDIFNYLLEFGFILKLVCSRSSVPENIHSKIKKKLDRQLKNGLISAEKFEEKLGDIEISGDLQTLKNSDLIIECITEDLDLKSKLLVEMDEIANDSCIFASNTSSFIPSLLMKNIKRTDRFCDIHFFYPVKLKDAVEVIYPDKTDDADKQTVEKFLYMIEKRPVIQSEAEPFLINRILLEIQATAFNILENSDKTPVKIDEIIKNGISEAGAFELMDKVGIKTVYTAIKGYVRDYDNRELYLPLIECLEKMINEGIDGFYSEEFDRLSVRKYDNCITSNNIRNDIIENLISFIDRITKKSKISNDDIRYMLLQFISGDIVTEIMDKIV